MIKSTKRYSLRRQGLRGYCIKIPDELLDKLNKTGFLSIKDNGLLYSEIESTDCYKSKIYVNDFFRYIYVPIEYVRTLDWKLKEKKSFAITDKGLIIYEENL